MTDIFVIKRGDRKEYLRRTLLDTNGNPVPIPVGATVKFYFRNAQTGELVVNGAAVTVIDAPTAVVEYRWGTTDTDKAGVYLAEFEVTSAGLPQTFPNDSYIYVTLLPDLRSWTTTATPYATVADLRAWGISSEEIGDDEALGRLMIASAIVNDYTGTRFGAAASTMTLYQVRTPQINLPRPFSSISAVTMNGTLLGTDTWQVTEWGIELSQCGVFWGNYLTADFAGYAIGMGWPILPYPYNYDPVGQTVTVTGVFGEATVPLAVNQATVLLAARLVRDRNVLTAGNAGGRITSESMQAFSRSWGLARGAEVQIRTTGDATVDDMLYVWRAQPQSHIA